MAIEPGSVVSSTENTCVCYRAWSSCELKEKMRLFVTESGAAVSSVEDIAVWNWNTSSQIDILKYTLAKH
jgi:hypothetical protein